MTEEELNSTKWWDYRLLTPTAATLEFTQEYVEFLD